METSRSSWFSKPLNSSPGASSGRLTKGKGERSSKERGNSTTKDVVGFLALLYVECHESPGLGGGEALALGHELEAELAVLPVRSRVTTGTAPNPMRVGVLSEHKLWAFYSDPNSQLVRCLLPRKVSVHFL